MLIFLKKWTPIILGLGRFSDGCGYIEATGFYKEKQWEKDLACVTFLGQEFLSKKLFRFEHLFVCPQQSQYLTHKAADGHFA